MHALTMTILTAILRLAPNYDLLIKTPYTVAYNGEKPGTHDHMYHSTSRKSIARPVHVLIGETEVRTFFWR